MTAGIWLLPTKDAPRKTLFLDRDGVINVDEDYLSHPDEVRLIDGSAEALAKASQAGWRLLCVTNQSGIGRGYYSDDDFRAVQRRVDELLAAGGVTLDGLLYCPHDPDAGCDCRKPSTGMIDEFRRHVAWTPASWMIGDKAADLELGRRCGLATALVRTGYGAETERSGSAGDALIGDDLAAVIDMILEGGGP